MEIMKGNLFFYEVLIVIKITHTIKRYSVLNYKVEYPNKHPLFFPL
jgi:hypothetical protein